MEQYMDQLIETLVILRRKHKKQWVKIREDRLTKLLTLPPEIDPEEFLKAFLEDPRIKRVHKLTDEFEKVPAVQLRYDTYTKVIGKIVDSK